MIRYGAGWTDAQRVTHFRNALRNKVMDWYDTLECFRVDTANKIGIKSKKVLKLKTMLMALV